VDALKAALIKTRAKLSGAQALIEHQRLLIEKMKRAMFGSRSERSQRLLEQLELQLEETAAAAGEDEIKAQSAGIRVESFTRRKATRRNFPDHLPRRRIVHPPPTSCPCCGGTKLTKIGEDITETLDVVPRQWFVTEHVREKFSCRSCEKITQPPAPFHAIARGYAGPSLLAMVLVDKYANHQPLNRQSEQFEREGIELPLSTLADHVGACAATLMPLYELIKVHVFVAARIHGDDTTVPVLAKTKTRTGRLWAYVRDDRPFGGRAPPAAVFFYSADRAGVHPERHLAGYTGILQADAYAGFNTVYKADRAAGPITEAACWAHGRRKFFELADIASKARNKKSTTISPLDDSRTRQALAPQRYRQGDGLHAQAGRSVHPLPRRWLHLSEQQRSRACAARDCARPQGLALCRLRSRRRSRCRHVHPDADRQAQRCRSAGLARRRARTHQRSRHPQA
jgi:transposase